MVSNVLNIGPEELLAELRRMREQYTDDPEYAQARVQLPSDWSI